VLSGNTRSPSLAQVLVPQVFYRGVCMLVDWVDNLMNLQGTPIASAATMRQHSAYDGRLRV
jgi:hypothetical protein